jgi:hypothetical protein
MVSNRLSRCRLEIWEEGKDGVRCGAICMLASSARFLARLDRLAMHGNRLRYMTQMYTRRDKWS